MRWAGHVACMGERRSLYLVGEKCIMRSFITCILLQE
jgi:hypothetical protein